MYQKENFDDISSELNKLEEDPIKELNFITNLINQFEEGKWQYGNKGHGNNSFF